MRCDWAVALYTGAFHVWNQPSRHGSNPVSCLGFVPIIAKKKPCFFCVRLACRLSCLFVIIFGSPVSSSVCPLTGSNAAVLPDREDVAARGFDVPDTADPVR